MKLDTIKNHLASKTVTQVLNAINRSPSIPQKAFSNQLENAIFLNTTRQIKLSSLFNDKNPYLNNAWVFGSISKTATNIAQLPIGIDNINTKDDKLDFEHELIDIFNNPNPNMIGNQLIEAISILLDLTGEAFLIMPDRLQPTQKARQIFVVLSNTMQEVTNQDTGQLMGWMHSTAKGKKIPYNLSQVVHIKYFNIWSQNRGLARWRASKSAVDLDSFATDYNKRFFEKGVTLSGILEVPSDVTLTDDQFKRMWQQFNDEHASVDRAFSVYISEGGAVFKPSDIKISDMAFQELKRMTREEVFAVFGTNDVILGLHDDVKSEAGTKTIHRKWWEESLIPRIQLIEQHLNNQYFKWVNGGRFRIVFDLSEVEALRDDFTQKVQTAKDLFAMGYPANMINKRLSLGMDDVKELDVGYLPLGLVPVTFNRNINDTNGNGKQHYDSVMISKATNPDRRLVYQLFLKSQIQIENEIHTKLKRWLIQQRAIVLENLENLIKKDLTDMIFNEIEETSKLRKLLEPIYILGMKEGVELLSAELAQQVSFTAIEADALGVVTNRITRIPPLISDTIQQQIRGTLADGIVGRETVAELSNRIRDVYNFADVRSITIARTESATMINSGHYEALKKEGVEETIWTTAGDELVRDAHQIDGQIRKVGELFSNGLLYPNDPNATDAGLVVNCRCTNPVIIRNQF